MVYPVPFFKVQLAGTIYADIWNTSLNVVPGVGDAPADDSILATVAAATQTWFTGVAATGVGFHNNTRLVSVKVNRIGPDGTYMDPNPKTHIYPTPVPGAVTAVNYPPQNAVVVSLRTAFDRGLANRGRMYLPLMTGFAVLDTSGRAAVADALRVSNSVASYINQLNAAFQGWSGGGDQSHVAIMSNAGAGAFHFVTRVATGRVVDTVRSRRNKLVEDPQFTATAIP